MVLKTRMGIIAAGVIVLSACLISMFAQKSTAEDDQVAQKLEQILDRQRDILDAVSRVSSDVQSMQHDVSAIKEKVRTL